MWISVIYRDKALKFRNKTLLDVCKKNTRPTNFRLRHLWILDGFSFLVIAVYKLNEFDVHKCYV